MVDVTVSADIAHPADEVAAFAGDPSNAPQWYGRIAAAEWLTEPPLRVGSQITFSARFMGRELVYTYEVTELVPGRALTMTTAEGPFPMTTNYEWQPISPESCRMVMRNHGHPAGWSRAMAPFMPIAMRRAMRQDLALLATILESR